MGLIQENVNGVSHMMSHTRADWLGSIATLSLIRRSLYINAVFSRRSYEYYNFNTSETLLPAYPCCVLSIVHRFISWISNVQEVRILCLEYNHHNGLPSTYGL